MDLNGAIKDYELATNEFYELVVGLSAEALDKPSPDGWNARQVIHHVADSEAQSYARLRRLIAEPGTVIQGYDESAWGENQTLGYKELPVENSISVFKAVRSSSLDLLKRLKPEQLSNSGTHTESGNYTIEMWLKTYANHPKDHANQIRKI